MVPSLLEGDAPHSPPRSVTDRLSQIRGTLPSSATGDDAGITVARGQPCNNRL
ncbi:hypothetical protein Pd630_LPD09142 (plasmid) [Rhodococcus opacus PD630]|nr:hypothetical protein Pd630_LPD09142 [Rhodococcus opacus PD630]